MARELEAGTGWDRHCVAVGRPASVEYRELRVVLWAVMDAAEGIGDERPVRDGRSGRTRQRIIDAATHRFAEQGFRGTRLDDVAVDVGLTKTAILKYFGSKDDLLFEVHRAAALSFLGFMDAPDDVLEGGFFETLRYWLSRSEKLRHEDLERYRILLIGWHSTESELQERIKRFWLMEDPERTLDFVEFGKERGEIRPDLDSYVVAAMIDWVAEGFQGSLAATELDRGGLFHGGEDDEERYTVVVENILSMLRGALAPVEST